jgi:hypothetical protein
MLVQHLSQVFTLTSENRAEGHMQRLANMKMVQINRINTGRFGIRHLIDF